MRFASEFAEQALVGSGPCALARLRSRACRVGARPDEWCRSFYSGCCRSFVPDNLTAFIVYHATVPSHHACCPCNEACVSRWGGADLTCVRSAVRPLVSPYIRPVTCVGSATWAGQLSEGVMTWRPGQHLSYHSSPPGKTFSRCLMMVPKMRSCAYPSVRGHPELVLSADLGVSSGAVADPTEQELGNYTVARVDLTEHELGNYDVARVDPTEQELGNCDVAKVDPTEQEFGNCDVAKVDPTEQELGNCNVARVDPTEHELGNCDVGLLSRVESGANPEIWPRGRIRAQIRRFGREGEVGHKSEGLAERANSGANPEIWPRG
ncbi:hypothetical protein BHM03_00054797 [Ensete ventricosum]|uniref:Uncharacterized protein n=1 Tax=Ensete ventricosum TaxID=4639 RepID=A0A445MM71_ENSVE|nr:hypothetical protein BHM03_00054797 [Ensete ventricosum]